MALSERSTWWCSISGWTLFTVSALFFTLDAVRDESVVATVASVTFLVACVLFVIPVLASRPPSRRP